MGRLFMLFVMVALLAAALTAAQETTNPKTAEQVLQDLQKVDVQRSDAYKKMFDATKAEVAAVSPGKATALVNEYRATVAAYRDMLVAALKRNPDDETAFILIRSLGGLDLSEETIGILCSYLGKGEPAGKVDPKFKPGTTEMRKAVEWLKGQTTYPVCQILLGQGAQVIPIIKRKLKDFDKDTTAFSNSLEILLRLSTKQHIGAWIDQSDLSADQKTAAKRIVDRWQEDR